MPTSRFLSAQCLAVDDDPLSLKLVEAACRKLNLDFLKASDVHQMIDTLRDENPSLSLILLDNDIAGVRGHEVLAYVENHLRSTTQIIVYSSSVTPADKSQYSRFNVKEYLAKPLTVDSLGFAIRRTLKL